MISFVVGSRTDVGRVRAGNQDALYIGDRLFAVADGMGGHAGGEVASLLVVERLDDGVQEWTTDGIVDLVVSANKAIVARAEIETELRGMGTTITLLAHLAPTDNLPDERIAIANVGDSRAYVFDGQDLQQLTDDHTLVQRLVRSGALTPEQAEEHPQRNVLTRALGIASDVLVDTWELRVFVGDRFLLCSDGLHGELDDEQIAAVLRRLADPQEAADELVRLANDAGGHDNITVVVADVAQGEERPSDGTGEHERLVAQVAGEDRPHDHVVDEPEPVAIAPVHVDIDALKAEVAKATAASAAEFAGEAAPVARRRRFTWRVALFIAGVLAVAALAVGAITYSARNTYFVAVDGDELVIYRGSPGGVLWIDPTVEERTGLSVSEVPVRLLPELEAGKEFGSLEDAEAFVANVQEEIGASGAPTPSTTVPPGSAAPPDPASP